MAAGVVAFILSFPGTELYVVSGPARSRQQLVRDGRSGEKRQFGFTWQSVGCIKDAIREIKIEIPQEDPNAKWHD